MTSGIAARLVRPHSCEVEVVGQPRTRFPDLTVLDNCHIPLIHRRLTNTRDASTSNDCGSREPKW